MPILDSGKKRMRQAITRKTVNDSRKRAMKERIKEVKKFIIKKEVDLAKALMPKVFQALDKAAKRGVIKKNTADRSKSRITAHIAKLDTK